MPDNLPAGSRDAVRIIISPNLGLETAQFAAELAQMYRGYAERHGWTVEWLPDSRTPSMGTLVETVLHITGAGVYRRLQHETGRHRLQRVPTILGSNRVHTSSARVVVVPAPDNVEAALEMPEEPLEVIRTYNFP